MFCLNYMYVLMTTFMESSEIPGGKHQVGYSSQDSTFLIKNKYTNLEYKESCFLILTITKLEYKKMKLFPHSSFFCTFVEIE